MIDENLLIIPRPEMQHLAIGDKNILIDCCSTQIDITDAYSMNGTAMWMWQQVNDSKLTVKALAQLLYETFDITAQQAKQDTNEQLSEWLAMGLITTQPAD
mgnify:CR=1 FL=1